MKPGGVILSLIAAVLSIGSIRPVAQEQPVATFKAGVDLVRVAAVVRDRRGKFVRDLKPADFQVLVDGIARPITDFRQDLTGVSVALLFDVSGSMENRLNPAREAAMHVLSWLQASRDEAGVFTFDTQLDEVTPLTRGLQQLPERLSTITPFGATSLHDAIAQTAQRLDSREGRRRAVVVFTDGLDNASKLDPREVSGIASAIDVPVYVVGVVPAIDNPASDSATPLAERSALASSLRDLASWTGGHTFVVSTPSERSTVAQQIVSELRHQYLIAFESSGRPGWHPLEVRARGKDLLVRARSGYFAGQSRPVS